MERIIQVESYNPREARWSSSPCSSGHIEINTNQNTFAYMVVSVCSSSPPTRTAASLRTTRSPELESNMHILVTNDDGVQAPGLVALAQEMRKIATVTVFAPDRNWSASGHVKTLERPLRVVETTLVDGSTAFA